MESAPIPLDTKVVAIFPGWRLIRIGGRRYAVSTELKRAVTWGNCLFGADSFAVYEGPLGKPASRLLALPVTESVKTEDLRPAGLVGVGGRRLQVFSGLTEWFVHLTDTSGTYGFRALVAVDGTELFPPRPLELAKRFYDDIESVAPRRQKIPVAQARAVVFKEIHDLLATSYEKLEQLDVGALSSSVISQTSDLLAELDAHAYALVGATAKARYLEILVRDWTIEKQEVAILEIFKAIGDRQELADATRKLPPDIYGELFDDVEGQLWSLLVIVGERFGEPELFTLPVLIDIIRQLAGSELPPALAKALQYRGPDLPPVVDETALEKVADAANELLQMGVKMVEGLWVLLSDPLKIVEGAVHLMPLAIEWQLAQLGWPPAVEHMNRVVDQILASAARSVVNAFKGAQVLGVLDKVGTKLRWMIVLEAASWVVGPGEIKAGVKLAVELAERAVAITRILRALRAFDALGEFAEVVAKLSRLAELLAKERMLAQSEDALRLLSHLPETDLERLADALGHISDAELRSARTLAEVAGHDVELAAALTKAGRRFEALAALEARVGRLSDAMVAAFKRLAGHSQFAEGDELFRLMASIPPEDAELFARTVNKLSDAAFARRRAGFFLNLAYHPGQQEFILDHGYEAWRILNQHAGYDFERTQQYLDAFVRRGILADPATREAEHAAFAKRLADGDDGALSELDEIRRAMQRERGALPSYDDAAIGRWFADQGGKPSIQQVRAFASTIDHGSRGRLFERWLRDNVFGGRQRRLVVELENNPGLELTQMSRTTDFVDLGDGRGLSVIWDGKCYTRGTALDWVQLDDYRVIEEAGSVFEKVGTSGGADVLQEVRVRGIAYIFADEAAATEAANELLIYGAEAWFIDDAGALRLFR